jgi:hypothetical protein
MIRARVHAWLFVLALAASTVALAGCASSRTPTAAPAATPASAPEAAPDLPGAGASAPRAARAATTDPPRSERERLLEMFARGYFPGRSGQVFLVAREGDVITDRDPNYGFMHGSPWDYDTHIPFLLHGTPFVRAGRSAMPVHQQDMAPTLGALLDMAPLATMTGRVLESALDRAAGRPRVIVLFVLDGVRADYLERYADLMPTLSGWARQGAWFTEARVNYLPTLTSVGHATVGTGADPRVHGLAANNLFNRVTGKPQPAYDGLDPRELMALTLADAWNLATDGRAIIVGQGGAIRATAGLVGQGACLINGRPVIAASYSTRDGGWETNPTCYRLPDYLQAINGRALWEAAGGRWMGHDVGNPSSFRYSGLFQRLEGEALMAVATNEAFGADEVTDLLLVNMKGPDYVGHAFGPDSAELKETLAEMDRQMTRVMETIERKAGANRTVVAVTADHGMPAEPPPGRRHYNHDIVALIHGRFDPEGKALVQYYGDTANGQIYLDTARLGSLGFSLNDVARFLEAQDFIVAAFTEDEVRRASAARR